MRGQEEGVKIKVRDSAWLLGIGQMTLRESISGPAREKPEAPAMG